MLSLALIVTLFFLPVYSAAAVAETLNVQTFAIDEIVAVVNDQVITQSDVQRALATIAAEFEAVYLDPDESVQRLAQARENIIEQMVEEKLIVAAAKESEILVDEEKIEQRIEQIKKTFSGEAEFEQALLAQGLTVQDLRQRFRDQQIMQTAVDYFVRLGIKVDPAEIEQFYQAHRDELVIPERVKVKSLLFKLEESEDEYQVLLEAKSALECIKRGDTFEKIARLCAQESSVAEAGDLGFVQKGQLIREIDEAIFGLNPGECSEVIKTPQGFRIFKVEEKEPAHPMTFGQAQDLVREKIYSDKFRTAFKEWIDKLKQNAYIVIKE